MKAVCGKTSRQQFPHFSPASGAHLRNIAETFAEMQDLRHAADYDNSRIWARTQVLDNIRLVRLAFASWRAIEKEPITEDFLLQLLIQR
jgi:hypothetical protein